MQKDVQLIQVLLADAGLHPNPRLETIQVSQQEVKRRPPPMKGFQFNARGTKTTWGGYK